MVKKKIIDSDIIGTCSLCGGPVIKLKNGDKKCRECGTLKPAPILPKYGAIIDMDNYDFNPYRRKW